jgi:hypothetical protein
MMAREPDPITRLFRACEPGLALAPGDPRYVNCDDVRGQNVVQLIERSLRRAEPLRPEVKLFAGHRGVGKTSELLRLKGHLEADRGGPPFFVVYMDVSEALDVNDLDFPDLLVFTAAAVQEQLRAVQIPGFSVVTTYMRRVWDDIRGLLGTEVAIREGEVDTPFGTLTLELKNRPNRRSVLRDAIERQSTSLLHALNDLLSAARVALRSSGREGVVLIIDGLDKLVRRPLDDGATNTHERLFIDRSEQLASLDAHTVYTVPISLIYSPRCAHLEQTFGEHNVPVPMIQLRGEGRSVPVPDTAGMKRMRDIVAARCDFAEISLAHAFDGDGTVHYLCEMSGGHPRHLMMFVQAACNAQDALPLTRKAAEQAVRHYANSLLREVPDEAWPKLAAFDDPRDDIPKDDLHQQMLFLLYVFEYMNGAPWYEVNPVLRTLDRFARSR